LIVAVNSDESVRHLKGPGRPLQHELARAHLLCCLRFVDLVVIFRGPRLAEEIRLIAPDVYVKASDYSMETLDPSEREALSKPNGRRTDTGILIVARRSWQNACEWYRTLTVSCRSLLRTDPSCTACRA
jgi:hypothetical protein